MPCRRGQYAEGACGRSAGSRCMSGALDARSLLVLDAHAAHITKDAKDTFAKDHTDIAVIPGGLTPHLQPLDFTINRSFKARLREFWTDWMINNKHIATKAGGIK